MMKKFSMIVAASLLSIGMASAQQIDLSMPKAASIMLWDG